MTSSSLLLIAIDGPAASGKGTLARRIAAELSLGYLDTGKLYRAVALRLRDAAAPIDSAAIAAEYARTLDLNTIASMELSDESVGRIASIISAYPEVREALLERQRSFAYGHSRGAVLDGRDIGTVILPDAPFKFFVTASLEVRARRRFKELQDKGNNIIEAAVFEELRARDERDQNRKVAPLKIAEGAIIVDSTDRDADDVFLDVLGRIQSSL